MTRAEFVSRATRLAERTLGVPPGWWGTYRDVTDGSARVSFSGLGWSVSLDGKRISRHDSRASAIRKASKL